MQPKGSCNSSSLSPGWVGVRTEALGRKPVVWESGACLGWELQRFPELLARLPLLCLPWPLLTASAVGQQHSPGPGSSSEDKGIPETPRELQLHFQQVLSLMLQSNPV